MTKPKKFVFVLMPFLTEFDDIYTYGIKQTCIELNTYCERVDEQIFSERILDRIYNQIAKADIIIADMTSRNANVFYEVGYAHALGKAVVLLTQKADDIPFDLKHFPHIVYNGQIKTLSTQLKPRIEWFLSEEIKEEIETFDFGLQFLIDGHLIENDSVVEITDEFMTTYSNIFNVKIDIYNSSLRTHKTKFKVGIESSIENKSLFGGLEFIKPSPEKFLFVSKEIVNIYPNAYKSVDFTIDKKKTDDGEPLIIEMKLKVFTNLEMREINFILKIPTEIILPWF